MRPSTVRGVNPVRVLAVEDHQMLIEALAARLSDTPDIVVVGHCAARDPHPEALVTVARPDVIAIEVTLAPDAAPLLTLLRTAWPPAHFVVLPPAGTPSRRSKQRGRARWDGYRRSPRSTPLSTPCDALAAGTRAFLQSSSAACCGSFEPTSVGRSNAKDRWTP